MRPHNRALPKALVLLASFFALTVSARAQYSVANLVFSGAAPYTDAELAATARIAPGQPLVRTSLATAAQHLLDTGLFDDAQVYLSGTGTARTVHFDLKPIPLNKLLPVSLENFIWFPPAELAEGIHAQVPLYRGVASDAGNLPDLIQTAISTLLTTKGVIANVNHILTEPSTQHPTRVIAFQVASPAIAVASLRLTFDTTDPNILAATKVALGRGLKYNEGLTGFTIQDFLLNPARNAGYIAAKVTSLDRQPTPDPTSPGVLVIATISPGVVYRISTISWDANPIYSAAEFARDSTLHTGDLATSLALAQTSAHIQAAYLSHGYLDAYLLPNPSPDDTAHTVAYAIRAVPGEIYHVKSITPNGLSPEAKADFDRALTLKPGDVYSDRAIAALYSNRTFPTLNAYSMNYQASADPITHQVDLTLTFTKTGAR